MEGHREERLVPIVEVADRDDAVDLRTTMAGCQDADDQVHFLGGHVEKLKVMQGIASVSTSVEHWHESDTHAIRCCAVRSDERRAA